MAFPPNTKPNDVVDAIKRFKPSKNGEKVKRVAFLYFDPQPPEDTFAQCGTCFMFTGKKCLILGDEPITAEMSCALYVHGDPRRDMAGQEERMLSNEEAGLVNMSVRCENCKYGGEECGLFKQLNQAVPDMFELETKIDPKGCCNAFTPG